MDPEILIIIFIFFSHLFLTSWAIIAFISAGAYTLYNIFFFISLLWSVHSSKLSTPTFIAFMIDALSIIMDIILIGISFSWRHSGPLFVFCLIATIFNLILRFPTSFILYRIYLQRIKTDGTTVVTLGNLNDTVRGYFNVQIAPAQHPQQTNNSNNSTIHAY